MNLISIITQFDPNYNYHALSKQSWHQIELVFSVEKEFLEAFLKLSIDLDIPYKYIVTRKNDFEVLLNLANSYFVLFMYPCEVWGDDYLKSIKQFFLERQDLGKSLKSSEQISVDPLSVNRNIFYFLGKIEVEGKNTPIMVLADDLHYQFSLARILKKPSYFQPGVKFLIPLNFVKDNNIKIRSLTDNLSFNIALFYLDVLTYLYKSNNYFEPNYYNCYIDFVNQLETVSLIKYLEVYQEEINLKKDIFLAEPYSNIAEGFRSLKKK